MPAFSITFNVTTDTRESARDAALMATYEAGEDVVVVRFSAPYVAPSVYGVKIWFRAPDADAALAYLKRLKSMPGQPPSDAYALHL